MLSERKYDKIRQCNHLTDHFNNVVQPVLIS